MTNRIMNFHESYRIWKHFKQEMERNEEFYIFQKLNSQSSESQLSSILFVFIMHHISFVLECL